MSRITRELALQHTRPQVLTGALPAIARTWLAPFEIELVEEVGLRRAAFGEDAPVSEAEAIVLRAALSGMERGIRVTFGAEHRDQVDRALDRIAVEVGDAA